MARPQKFRHSREALNDPQIAEKLGRFVLDIEALRQTRKQIDDQIAAAYDAVDDGGFEKKFVRKVVSLRAKETDKRRDEEEGLEVYEFAIEKGVSLACARKKPDLPPHDEETGEIIEQPETAHQSEQPCTATGPSAPLESASDTISSIISPSDLVSEPAVAKPQAPQTATADQSPDPHPSTVADGQRSVPNLAADGAKNEGLTDPSSVGTALADRHSIKAEQAVTLSPSSEASSSPLTTRGADAPPPVSAPTNFVNPRCQHPDTCHQVHSDDACFDCTLEWAKRPKDEQIRLWQEAKEAASETEAA